MWIDAAVSGAFLSAIKPNIPGSYLEGTDFNSDVSANQTLFTGPEAPQTARDLIENPPDPSTIEDLNSLFEFFDAVKEAYEQVARAYENAHRGPDVIQQGAGFLCTNDGATSWSTTMGSPTSSETARSASRLS